MHQSDSHGLECETISLVGKSKAGLDDVYRFISYCKPEEPYTSLDKILVFYLKY